MHATAGIGALSSLAFLGYLLYRQRQVRRVPTAVRPRGPAMFLLVGLFTFTGYLQATRVPVAAWLLLALSFAIGAGLGWWRAHTVRLWFEQRRLLRQGTWPTVGLWLLATALHTLAGLVIGATGGPTGLESATGMLYLAMSSLIQQVAVVRRGQRTRALVHAGS